MRPIASSMALSWSSASGRAAYIHLACGALRGSEGCVDGTPGLHLLTTRSVEIYAREGLSLGLGMHADSGECACRFATAPLITMGCIMMRKCHTNTCPVGIATQARRAILLKRGG